MRSRGSRGIDLFCRYDADLFGMTTARLLFLRLPQGLLLSRNRMREECLKIPVAYRFALHLSCCRCAAGTKLIDLLIVNGKRERSTIAISKREEPKSQPDGRAFAHLNSLGDTFGVEQRNTLPRVKSLLWNALL